jgi:hypothetical protein
MDLGIPKELRSREHRVSLTPSGAKVLVQLGHRLWVETGAGFDAGHPDADYQSAGATTAFSRMEALTRPQLLAGVAAPEPAARPAASREISFAFLPCRPASRPPVARSRSRPLAWEATETSAAAPRAQHSMSRSRKPALTLSQPPSTSSAARAS